MMYSSFMCILKYNFSLIIVIHTKIVISMKVCLSSAMAGICTLVAHYSTEPMHIRNMSHGFF